MGYVHRASLLGAYIHNLWLEYLDVYTVFERVLCINPYLSVYPLWPKSAECRPKGINGKMGEFPGATCHRRELNLYIRFRTTFIFCQQVTFPCHLFFTSDTHWNFSL